MPTGFVTVGQDFSGPTANPFENAASYLGISSSDNITKFVKDQIDFAESIVNESTTRAYTSIEALDDVQLLIPDTIVPVLDPLDFGFTFEFTTVPLDPTVFGIVPDYTLGPAPVFTGDTSINVPSIPNFTPSFTNFSVPPAPVLTLPPDPGNAPAVVPPVFPAAPILTDPVLPGFSQIVLPAAPNITIPTFSGVFPVFDGVAPDVAFNWNEPTFTETILDQTIAQIETFLAGGTGIKVNIQDLMFNQAVEREDRIAVQAIQEVTDDYAARGFTLPPGLLQKRINAVRSDRDLKKQGISREILIKTMDVEIENLRFAVEQGNIAEGLYVQMFLASVERTFLAQRLSIEFSIQLYQILVDIFRAKQEEVRTRANVYEVEVRAALTQIEIFKAQVDAELAKVQVDLAKVELYKAQIEGLKTFVEKYEAEVRAESAKLEAQRIQVLAFGETVNAYATRVGAEKIRFDGYESRVRGELGKAQILESEARAYASEVQGVESNVTAQARAIEGEVGAFTAGVQAYVAESTSFRDRANVQLEGIRAGVAGYQADTQRYVADINRQEAIGRINLAAWNAGLETQLGYYRTQLGKYDIDARLLSEQARLALGGLEAAGGLATTIVGGALAAMHVGATVSGSGSVSASGTLSDSYQTSKSISDSVNVSEDIAQSIRYNINADGGTDTVANAPPWVTGNT